MDKTKKPITQSSIPAFATQTQKSHTLNKTKEFSLFGFLIQKRQLSERERSNQPLDQLLQFCQFIQGSSNKSKHCQFKEYVRGFVPWTDL
jgi:hypothetical protein